MTDLIPDVLRDSPDWKWLRTTVRDRLEVDGAAATVVIDTDKLAPGENRVVRWLLRWPVTKSGQARVRLARLDRELSLRVTDGLDLRQTLSILGGPLGDQRADRRRDRLNRALQAQLTHAELVGLTATVPELADEHRALIHTPPNPHLRVPANSATLTHRWPVHEAAMRAAVIWYSRTKTGERLTAKQLAGEAWRNTKRWTLSRQLAFERLVRCRFEDAVDEPDTAVRIRGPLTWISEDIIADAKASHPWLSVPARGIRTLGFTTCDARGILLIENADTFEQVCGIPEITENWLCTWGSGYASNGLVRFLRELDLPLVAWGDLDADGIAIIMDLEKRVGRRVRSVGMSIDLWQDAVKREQTEEQLARARQLAAKIDAQHHPELLKLAAAIAESGEGCEQEPLHPKVLPGLPNELARLLSA